MIKLIFFINPKPDTDGDYSVKMYVTKYTFISSYIDSLSGEIRSYGADLSVSDSCVKWEDYWKCTAQKFNPIISIGVVNNGYGIFYLRTEWDREVYVSKIQFLIDSYNTQADDLCKIAAVFVKSKRANIGLARDISFGIDTHGVHEYDYST